ncbi:amidase [Streptomyces sp. NPDC091377]|uniref:amidase n=1 Tax=Streptomyces sp. NPDC091377 TaxID=3365995 RepID=UPI003823849A
MKPVPALSPPVAPCAHTIASAVRSGALHAVESVAAALDRIARIEPSLNAFREVWDEAALRHAAEVDARVAAGEALPLAGVPIGVKGRRTGLRAADARALIAAGCVPVGATSVPGPGTAWQTWGLGRYGRTVNPWRPDRTPGGSSAGSAAAVAAGLVPLATGSDGAGSIRIPAAWCGVIGLKTTNGRLPTPDRTGLASPGVLTRCPEDAALYMRLVSEPHGRPDGHLASPTATWSPDLGFATPDPEPLALAHSAALRLADTGAFTLAAPSPNPRLIDPAPAWTALRRTDTGTGTGTGTGIGIGIGIGIGTATCIGTGTGAFPPTRLAHPVQAANNARLSALFARTDLLLTPTTPNAPHGHDGPGERYSTELTWAFNLSGHPAISLPAGLDGDGCPAGLQIVAPHGREQTLLKVARRWAERSAGQAFNACAHNA